MNRTNARWRLVALGAVLLAAGLAGGCSRSSPPSGTKPAATAEAALRGFLQGMVNLDERAMLAHCKATDDESDALCALAEFGRAATGFRVMFVTAYGQEAWDRFNDPNYDPGEANANVTLIDGPVDELMSVAGLRVRGPAVATFVMPNESRQSQIVKTDSGWLLDVHTLLPPQIEPRKFAELMREMGRYLREYRKAIGESGITPDDIDVELGRAFVETFSETEMPFPHRFDIDDL